jgi:hypothetical protein
VPTFYYPQRAKSFTLNSEKFNLVSIIVVTTTLMMNKLRSLAVIACLIAPAGLLRATTVIPPTFDELVSRADVIFQGSVTDVRSQWIGEGAQRHIVTYVSFKVDEAIKGTPGSSYTMRMLGGTVDGQTMEVTDSPKFKLGDRDILFVEHNGEQFIPLVGIMHGRFRIERDPQDGHEIVATNSGERLADVTRLGKEEHVAASEKAAISPSEFKAAIHTNLQRLAAKRQ